MLKQKAPVGWHRKLLSASLFIITMSAITPAVAQSEPPEVNLTDAPFAKTARFLVDNGVYTTVRYTSQIASNPIGGQKQESAYIGKLDFGATLDLNKIVGMHGGLIHILFDDNSGENLSSRSINSSLSVQNLNLGANQESYQLAVLTWEQSLLNDKINFNVGRTDTAFLTSPFYCEFQSHANCGRPYGLSKLTAASFTPTAVWGGRLTVTPIPDWYAKVGIYQPNPSLQTTRSHGFDWSIRKASGYVLPLEVGYKRTPPGALFADQYDIGVLFSEAPYTLPFFNGKLPPENGRTALYVMAQKLVYQPSQNSPQGLYLFAYGLSGTDHSKQIENFQAAAGAILQAPFASRPHDSARVLVNELQYDSRYLDFLYKTRLGEHGTQRPHRDQLAFEINYTYHAARWLDVLPNIQYIVHPDGLASAKYPASNIPDALVFGMQISVDLASLAGGIASYPIRAVYSN
jgi:porin